MMALLLWARLVFLALLGSLVALYVWTACCTGKQK